MCISERREGSRLPLTKVRLVWTTLQLHSFRTALNQEVPHQLVGDVTCNNKREGGATKELINVETSLHIFGIKIIALILSPPC